MVAMREHALTLDAGFRYGRHIPSQACGIVLSVLPDLARQATGMAFARSPSPGRPGAWLAGSADLRVLDIAADPDTGATKIRYEAPLLGESAADLFAQETIPGLEQAFPRPDPQSTALDLIASLFADLGHHVADSPRLDPVLLATVHKLRKALSPRRGYDAIIMGRSQAVGGATERLTVEGCDQAGRWRRSTSEPRSARIEGKLDMLWDSAESFAILLDDGSFLPGSFTESVPESLANYFRERVTVIGKVVYRPSGKPLRIEAEAIEPCLASTPAFSSIPEAVSSRDRAIRSSDIMGRNGLADLLGMLDDPTIDEATFNRMVREIA